MYVFSEGFYINNSGTFDGSQKGAIIKFDAPMYYVTNYLNGGKGGIIFSLGDWGILDGQEENTAHVGLPTAIDSVNYIKNMEGVVTKINAGDEIYATELKAAGECFTNSELVIMEYDTDESGEGRYYSSDIPNAVVSYGLFKISGTNTTYSNMMALDYSKFIYKGLSGDWYGCNIVHDENKNTYLWVDKYIHFDDEIVSTYGTLPTDDAPERRNSRQGGQKYKEMLPTTGLVPMPAHSIQEDFPEAYNMQNRFAEKRRVQRK